MTEFSASGRSEALISDIATSRVVSRATKANKLRKHVSRLYTRNTFLGSEVQPFADGNDRTARIIEQLGARTRSEM